MITEYWHASESKLDDGTVLENRQMNLADDWVEKKLESARPKKAFNSRRDVTYAKSTRHFGNEGIQAKSIFRHRIEAEKVDGPFDFYWIGLLQRHPDNPNRSKYVRPVDNRLSVDEIAAAYWKQLPSDSPNWEYHCTNAVIAECIDDEPVDNSGGLPPI